MRTIPNRVNISLATMAPMPIEVVDRIIRHLDKNAVTPRSPPPMSAQLNPTLPTTISDPKCAFPRPENLVPTHSNTRATTYTCATTSAWLYKAFLGWRRAVAQQFRRRIQSPTGSLSVEEKLRKKKECVSSHVRKEEGGSHAPTQKMDGRVVCIGSGSGFRRDCLRTEE
jgi:hypothetical protein